MIEKQFNTQNYISDKRKERKELTKTWDKIEQLNTDFGLSCETYSELKSKISSRMAAIDQSIREHSKI